MKKLFVFCAASLLAVTCRASVTNSPAMQPFTNYIPDAALITVSVPDSTKVSGYRLMNVRKGDLVASPTNSGFLTTNDLVSYGVPGVIISSALPTPYMGFNTFYYSADRPTAVGFWANFFGAVTNMNQNGYVNAGYNLLVMDSGWWLTNGSGGVVRDANGNLMLATNNMAAPYFTTLGLTNIVPLVKYLATFGVKLGVYYEPNNMSLDGLPSGDLTNVENDALWFSTNGIAYIKFDGFGAGDSSSTAMITKDYFAQRMAADISYEHNPLILDVGYPTITADNYTPPANSFDFENCWRIAYGASGAWGYDLTGSEVVKWNEILHAIDMITPQAYLRQRGHMPSAESVPIQTDTIAMIRAGMGMWAVLGLPLEPILPSAPGDQNYAATMTIQTNADLIAIDQDMSGVARVVLTNGFTAVWYNATGGNGPTNDNEYGQEIIARPIGGSSFNSCKFIAVGMLNRASYFTATNTATTSISLTFASLGLGSNSVCYVYDIFNNTNCYATNSWTVAVGTNDMAFAKIFPLPPSAGSVPPNLFTLPATGSMNYLFQNLKECWPEDFVNLTGVTFDNGSNFQSPSYFADFLNIPKTGGAWGADFCRVATTVTNANVTIYYYWPGTGNLTWTNHLRARTNNRNNGGLESWYDNDFAFTVTNNVTAITVSNVYWETGSTPLDFATRQFDILSASNNSAPTNTTANLQILRVAIQYTGFWTNYQPDGFSAY